MNGQIRVYSLQNRGTVFVVGIPTVEADNNFNGLNPRNENQIIGKLQSLNIHSMVVDDASFNLKLMAQFLTKMKIEVESASVNGK